MGREVLSSTEYQSLEQGYVIDNVPWQEEIKKRLRERPEVRITETRPTLGPEEFQPLLLAETPEAVEEVKPPEPTAEEMAAQKLAEAEENAKSIEQAAKKNAYEIGERARWEANDLLTKAKEEAEKEIQQLKESAAEEGRKEGAAKGFEEGLAKGREDGRKEYEGSVRNWDLLAGKLPEERKALIGDLQPMLVGLVGDVLYRCLKDEGQRNGQMAVAFAKEALERAQDRVHLKLHLNPADLEEVAAQKERLQLSVGAGGLELVPDARIEKGGCLLETEAGSVDVRLTTVVAQAKGSLEAELGRTRSV